MDKLEYTIETFKSNDLDINEIQAEKFLLFYSMVVEKNQQVNLTSITDFEEFVVKHLVDSAILVKYVSIENKSIIDVGTGGGFPGIPLKILCPGIRITLLDSLKKRIDFLNEVIYKLEMTDITAIHSRAEDLAHLDEHREKYDIALSRAVSNLTTLSEYCIPFVHVSGYFCSYKSQKYQDELTEAEYAIKQLGGKVSSIYDFALSGTDYSRSIIEIKKISSTVGKYPRRGNKPVSAPLKNNNFLLT